MSVPVNILLFPSEAENAFELYRALRFAPRFRVFGASSRPGHADFLFEHNTNNLPRIEAADFIPAFNRFLREKQIDLVFPTHDSVAAYLTRRLADLDAIIVCSNAETALICRRKTLFYEALREEAYCPAVYADVAGITAYPVFLKPDQGQGGQGCLLADSPDELERALASRSDLLITEYLPGSECTVDCFSDRHGRLLFSGPRSRDVVKLGISFESASLEHDPELERIALRLNERFKPRGLWFFQAKKNAAGLWKVLEMSVRAAGTMGLYRQAGVNFALLAAYDALDMDVRILSNGFSVRLSRCLHSSYALSLDYTAVYLDLDDTLLVRGEVNLTAMAFLYQCLNRRKTVILLTRHAGDVLACLREHRIDPGLFQHIVQLAPAERKSDHITVNKAIFIDNLFAERREVLEKLGIPVFDVDALESLLQI